MEIGNSSSIPGYSFICELAVEFAFTDETAAQQSEEHHNNQKGESLVGGPAIRVPDNPGSCWVEGFDEIQTFSYAFNNLIDILTVA